LRSAGIVPPRQPGLWTKKGLAWLRQLALPTASLQLRRDLLLEEIETLIQQVQRIEQQLNHQAGRSPAVTLLQTIPGVGVRTAEAVAAFIDDPHRFPHSKSVGRYFGLVPSQDQPAGHGQEAKRGLARIACHIITHNTERAHVKIESGIQVASRRPHWRIATPLA
jgi:transposase